MPKRTNQQLVKGIKSMVSKRAAELAIQRMRKNPGVKVGDCSIIAGQRTLEIMLNHRLLFQVRDIEEGVNRLYLNHNLADALFCEVSFPN